MTEESDIKFLFVYFNVLTSSILQGQNPIPDPLDRELIPVVTDKDEHQYYR